MNIIYTKYHDSTNYIAKLYSKVHSIKISKLYKIIISTQIIKIF
jgi:hypothetical protein